MDKSVQKLLDSKEKNRLFINKLFDNNKFVITLNLNIPGIIKSNKLYNSFFKKISTLFLNWLSMKYKMYKRIENHDTSGNHLYITIDNNFKPEQVKKILIDFEDKIGDISKYVDIDLLISPDKPFSRSELSVKERKCFICNESAKVCARNQTHSYEELTELINKEIEHYIDMSKNVRQLWVWRTRD